MSNSLFYYLAAINVLTFIVYAKDKEAAIQGRRRASEANMLGLALIGGGISAVIAQQLLRHKTRKQPFRTILWLIAGLQVVGFPVWLLIHQTA